MYFGFLSFSSTDFLLSFSSSQTPAHAPLQSPEACPCTSASCPSPPPTSCSPSPPPFKLLLTLLCSRQKLVHVLRLPVLLLHRLLALLLLLLLLLQLVVHLVVLKNCRILLKRGRHLVFGGCLQFCLLLGHHGLLHPVATIVALTALLCPKYAWLVHLGLLHCLWDDIMEVRSHCSLFVESTQQKDCNGSSPP